MPAPKDPEFRRRAVELARLREKPIAQTARDLDIAESGILRDRVHACIDPNAENSRGQLFDGAALS